MDPVNDPITKTAANCESDSSNDSLQEDLDPKEKTKDDDSLNAGAPSVDEDDQDSTDTSDEEDAKEGSPEFDRQKNEIKERAKTVQELLASTDLESNESGQRDLLERFWRILRPATSPAGRAVDIESRNVLYYLASRSVGEPSHPWLVKHLVKEYPSLLKDGDWRHERVLTVAIRKGKVDFIRAILDSGIEESKLQPELEYSADETKKNCIHFAVEVGFDPYVIMRLVENASRDALAAPNLQGQTPLHLAVDYKRCSSLQLDVVKTLLKHGDAALDLWTRQPEVHSVYTLYFRSRRQFQIGKELERVNQMTKRSQARSEGRKTSARPSGEREAKEKRKSSSKLLGTVGNKKLHPMNRREGLQETEDFARTSKEKRKPQRETYEDHPEPSSSKPQLSPALMRQSPTETSASECAPQVVQPFSAQSYLAKDNTIQTQQDVHSIPTRGGEPNPASKASAMNALAPQKVKVHKTHSHDKARSSIASRAMDESSRKDAADKIAHELKLHYFRTIFRPQADDPGSEESVKSTNSPGNRSRRTHQTAERFLFGDNVECKQSHALCPLQGCTS